MREREPQAELSGERAAVIRGAEQPYFGRSASRGLGLDLDVRMVRGQRAVEETDQVLHLLRHVLRALVFAVHQRERGARVPARRAADAQIDAPGKQGFEHAELLGDFQRTVVGQEHTARADADARGGAGDAGDENLGTGIGESRDGVVLGEPVAVVAQLFGEPGERDGFSDRLSGTVSADDRGLIEHP